MCEQASDEHLDSRFELFLRGSGMCPDSLTASTRALDARLVYRGCSGEAATTGHALLFGSPKLNLSRD
jgi:hypothetical protein